MYILGISDSHCATATLLKNGTIIACASEERFTRVKTQAGIPVQSIRYCLTAAGIDGSDLDSVAFAGEFNSFVDLSSNPNTEKNTHSYHRDTSLATKLYHFGRHYFYVYFERGLENKFPQLRNINKYIYKVSANILTPHLKRARTDFVSNLLDISPEKIIFVEHHLCHAYAALFASPFPRQGQKALVFTSDGQGDGLSSTLSVFRNGTLSRISKSSSTESLGALYAEITMFLGMKLGEDEYKVMGLAPYGKPRDSARAYEILKKLVWVDKKALTIKTAINSELFDGYLQKHLVKIRFDGVASAIQKLTEDMLAEWVEAAITHFDIHTIVCGGGVFMNVKSNQRLLELPHVREMFVMPSSGDESNAIGAAYWAHLHNKKNVQKIPKPIKTLYLGPEYSSKQIVQTLKLLPKSNYRVSQHKNIETKIVDLLVRGEAVALFQGRMEFGARALCHRSILADASNIRNIQILNKMIKGRDFWMPFAPVILDSWEEKYLDNPKLFLAHYMNMAFNSTARGRQDLPAAIHPYDNTLRPQVVEKKTDAFLYKILKVYEKKTKRGGFLNTSFNLHGEPIVCSPDDAINTLKRSGLKYLAIDNLLVAKC